MKKTKLLACFLAVVMVFSAATMFVSAARFSNGYQNGYTSNNFEVHCTYNADGIIIYTVILVVDPIRLPGRYVAGVQLAVEYEDGTWDVQTDWDSQDYTQLSSGDTLYAAVSVYNLDGKAVRTVCYDCYVTVNGEEAWIFSY